MPGLFELTDFALDYVTTDQGATWTGGGQVDGEGAIEGSEAIVHVDLVVESGAIATADSSADGLALGGLFSLRDVALHYGAGEDGADPEWSGTGGLYIEGSDERAAHLDLVVGEGRLQSATGDVADLGVAGLVRIVNGHAEYDDEAGWRLTAEKASIRTLDRKSAVEGKRVDVRDDIWGGCVVKKKQKETKYT